MVEAMGVPVNMTTKKLSEGHPNVVDVIEDGSVGAVVNTVNGGKLGVAGRVLHPPGCRRGAKSPASHRWTRPGPQSKAC